MRDDQLGRLLRHAEEQSTPLARSAGDLAAQVRNLDRHRRARSRRLGVLAACTVVAAVAWQAIRLQTTETTSVPVAQEQPARVDQGSAASTGSGAIDARLAEIASELSVFAHGQKLIERERQWDMVRHEAAQPDTLDEIDMQLDLVANGMLRRVDDLLGKMPPGSEVIAAYQHLIELYPRTPSAALARARLAALQN